METSKEINKYIISKDENKEKHISGRLIEVYNQNKFNFSVKNNKIELITSEKRIDYPVTDYYLSANTLFRDKGFNVILDKKEGKYDTVYLELP
jgi:hypothetical protein